MQGSKGFGNGVHNTYIIAIAQFVTHRLNWCDTFVSAQEKIISGLVDMTQNVLGGKNLDENNIIESIN